MARSAPPRLVADIGGTNGRFAIIRDGRVTSKRAYRNEQFDDMAALVARYLEDVGEASGDVEAACLAVAAPIGDDGRVRFTNKSSWQFGSADLTKAIGFERVEIINDFAAQAYGLEALGAKGTVHVAGPTKRAKATAPRVILGPGTGLGCAALVPGVDDGAVAVTSEGGHMGYAAETDADRRILAHATERYGRVSWERVCCGSGLALVHDALYPRHRLAGVADGDPARVVEAARRNARSEAAASVRQWCGMLGAFSGDLALVFRAAGGVYLSGGVIGHLDRAFDVDAFMKRFVDKGRYREWLAGLAVRRVVSGDIALKGCGRFLERTA